MPSDDTWEEAVSKLEERYQAVLRGDPDITEHEHSDVTANALIGLNIFVYIVILGLLIAFATFYFKGQKLCRFFL